jgi:hypothetical protein
MPLLSAVGISGLQAGEDVKDFPSFVDQCVGGWATQALDCTARRPGD